MILFGPDLFCRRPRCEGVTIRVFKDVTLLASRPRRNTESEEAGADSPVLAAAAAASGAT